MGMKFGLWHFLMKIFERRALKGTFGSRKDESIGTG
jgi:hypothetical protein